MTKQRFLTVSGTGSLSLKPDTIIINCDLANQAANYAACMQTATEQTVQCKSALLSAGVNGANIKTDSFQISVHYAAQQNENGLSQNVPDGYVCRHTLRIRLACNLALLGNVISALSECPAAPEFRICFTVENKTAAKAALLEAAVTNARASAETIAKASGLRLGEIFSIDYTPQDLDFSSPTQYHMPRLMSAKASAPDIMPQDVTLRESVTISWQILNA